MIEVSNADIVAIEGIHNATFRTHICTKLAELLRNKNEDEIKAFSLSNVFGRLSIQDETEEVQVKGSKFGTSFVFIFRDTSENLVLKVRLIKTTREMILLGDIIEPQGIWEVKKETEGSVSKILGINSVNEGVKKDLETRYKKSWEILHERGYTE